MAECCVESRSPIKLPKILAGRHLNDLNHFPRATVPVIEMHQQRFESYQTLRALVDGCERLPVHIEYDITYGLRYVKTKKTR